jgi:carboxyl-terminal processing protease
VDDSLFSSFLTYVRQNDISYTAADLDSTASYIRSTLRSELIRKSHGDNEAYKATIDQDKQLQQAIALFDRFSTMEAMFEHAASIPKKR